MHRGNTSASETETAPPSDRGWLEARPELRDAFAPIARVSVGDITCVYKVRREIDGRVGALKFLSSGAFGHTSSRARLGHEAAVLRDLRSPVAVRLVDAVVGGPAPYLFLEHVDGTPVDVDGMSSPVRIAEVGVAVGAVLRELHAAGRTHRALEPAHVLRTARGVRLLGFGHVSSEEGRLTAKGIRVGSVAYAAPEQLRGERPTPATDVYGLSTLLMAMSVGKRPWANKNIAQIVAAAPTGCPFDDGAFLRLPGPKRTFFRRALSPSPEDRPGLAGLLRELQTWAADYPTLDEIA